MTALRYGPRADPVVRQHADYDLVAASAIVERHGHDSLSPFILRPDKTFQFAAGAVLAYRVIGATAIVSGDPIGPEDGVSRLLTSFVRFAHAQGWRVVLWGTSARYLSSYRALGLRQLCAGEEAVVYPAGFSLHGRSVRKLRQSVHRLERRGWKILAREGCDLDEELELEIDALELAWRASKARMLGFAMGMGEFRSTARPRDLYLLARAPDGELGAVMHFISHCGKLSLDTMRRVVRPPTVSTRRWCATRSRSPGSEASARSASTTQASRTWFERGRTAIR